MNRGLRIVTGVVSHQANARRYEIRVPKTAEIVAKHVRDRIVRGELQDGDALPSENVLMTQFGISRPTLREAFRILEAEALITVRRGARGGARVHPPSPEVASRYAALVLQHRGATLGDLNQARVLLEAPIAGALARLPEREAVVDKLTDLLTEAEARTDDPEAMVEAHFEFHRQVVASVGNPVVTLLLDLVEGVFEESGRSYLQRRDRAEAERNRRAALEAHARLLDLVRAGDADGAVALWRAHLGEVGQLVTDAEADEAAVLDCLDH